ncbi:MAG: MFS transporter [Alphaproteobacteria bacterium]|jgi:AAA family ATP:ADP antiporter|nr:MFS transporter [Alphaproteobacteria bacterium]|tara:strand:+ start:345 stop:1640 length:1296 start_codon:yes stop_codon:yes gene_type:complete
MDRLKRAFEGAVRVRDEEIRALVLSFLYFFCLLAGYYVLRPLRDEMGIAGGVRNLQWLFTGTFIAMLIAVPLYGAIVARWRRQTFLPFVYHFFAANIFIFYLLFLWGEGTVHTARAFFIWVSIFNLYVVSVFWSFMADLFSNEQGKRLFGFIAAGGSAGAIAGPLLAASLVELVGTANLLLIAIVFLELAVLCIRALIRRTPSAPTEYAGPRDGDLDDDRAIGGSILAGATTVARSPYLIGICVYMVLYTATSTFLYMEQAHIVASASDDPETRTRIFASIDLAVGVLTLATQLFLTGRLMSWFGVGLTVAFVPLLTALGFAVLAVAPALGAVIVFQTLRRAANFAVSRPAREVLYTVVGREEKYKSKNFIDTVIYRGGDAVSGWAFAGLAAVGMGIGAIAILIVPVALVWAGIGIALGRRQDTLATNSAK